MTIDERVLRAVRIAAARSGRRDSDVMEEAIRRGLGLDVFDRLWAQAELDEGEALALAVGAQHDARA